MITVKSFTTGYVIPKIPNYRFYGLENFFTSFNQHTKERDPFGIIETEQVYRIPKIEPELLSKLLKAEFEIQDVGYTPVKPFSKPVILKNPPKDEIQQDVINNVMNHFNQGEHRVVISLPTGRGKTYVATNIFSQLKMPTIIFVKSVTLRDQWVQSFYTHSNCRNIAVCTGSSDLVDLLDSSLRFDVIIATHRTFQNFIDLVGMKEFNRLLINQGIGLKIFDEFDLEADSTFKIETHTSIAKTLYLSATDYKSPNCDKVFQAVYGHLPNYGKNYGIVVERNAIFVLYNSKPTRPEFGRVHRYSKDGPQFDYHKYHESIITRKSYEPGLKILWDKLIKNSFYSEDQYLKTVFFIGRKVTAEQFKKDLSQLTGVPLKSIAILNSDTPDKDRERMMKYKLIISTADSMGRGIDLKGLDIVVDFETRASKSKTTQVIGRVSRSGATHPGTYISFVDVAFPTVYRNYQFKLDSGFYETQFTKMRSLDLTKK